jgi:hypothetical protein
MPERTVTIRLSVDSSGAVTGIQNYSNAMKDAKDKTQGTDNAVKDLRNLIGGMFTVAAISGAVDFTTEMVNMGREVDATREIFTKLVGGMGEADRIMQQMRDATMGVVTDQSLQAGANMLLRMGIAESPEQLDDIIGMITRLKKPTEDMSSAIENFSLMMANQSVLRLDSFGLSAGRVRARINELLASGEALNRSEAFTMAVLEDGQRQIERLGSASGVAGTALSRLETRWQNFVDNVAVGAADLGQGFATSVEAISGTTPEQQMLNSAETNPFLRQKEYAFKHLRADPQLAGASDEFLNAVIQNAVFMAWHNPESVEEMRQGRTDLIDQLLEGAGEAPAGLESDAILGILGGSAVDLSRYSVYVESQQQRALDLLDTLRLQRAEEERTAAILEKQESLREQMHNRAKEMMTAQQQEERARGQTRASLLGSVSAVSDMAVGEAFQFAGSPDDGLPEFSTQAQADNLQRMADEAQAIVDQMRELDAADNQLFTDEQIASSQAIADNVGRMADNAQKGADALANLTLAQATGQSGGGITGEISDQAIAEMEAQGATPEQIEAARRTFDLQSGRQTATSLAMTETVAPALATMAMTDAEGAANTAAELEQMYKDAALAGIDTAAPAFAEALSAAFASPEMAAGFDSETFLSDFEKNMDSVDKLKAKIAELSGMRADINLRFVVENADFGALTNLLRPIVAQINADNGGVSPGTRTGMGTIGQGGE